MKGDILDNFSFVLEGDSSVMVHHMGDGQVVLSQVDDAFTGKVESVALGLEELRSIVRFLEELDPMAAADKNTDRRNEAFASL